MTKKGKDVEQVKKVYKAIMQENLSLSREEIIKILSDNTGKRESIIKEIISSDPNYFDFDQTNNDQFAKLYMEIASDGVKNREFEEMTRKIFSNLGLPTEKLKYKTETGNELEIDGFIKNNDVLLSGIMDAKSGKKFSCGNKEVGIMKDYISSFKQFKSDEKMYHLNFFAYVYGKKFENMSNFYLIIKESKTHGVIISARELLRIREKFQSGEISRRRIWNLFASDREIRL